MKISLKVIKFHYKPNFDSPILFMLFSAWCAEKQIQTPLEAIKIGQLDQNPCRFYTEVRKKTAKISIDLLAGTSSFGRKIPQWNFVFTDLKVSTIN